MTIGISTAPLRRRVVASGPPDLATLNLSQYHEQGRGFDFNPAGSPPWVGLASAGASLGRDLVTFGSAPWILPTTGSAIDGTTMVRFGTDLRDLKSQVTVPSILTVSAFTIGLLVKLDATVGALDIGTSTSGQCLFFSTFVNIFGGQVGGLGRVKLHTVSTIDNFALSSTFPLGTWVAITARFGGGSLDVRINKATATPSAGVANVNAGWSGQTARVAHSSNGCSIHDRLALYTAQTRLSDADSDLAHDWWKHKFPTAGLP